MNHAKILVSIALAGILTTGCSIFGTQAPATAEDYKIAVANANNTISKAKKMAYEWRDSKKILKAADKAAKAGDYDKATTMANKAMRQGELAIIQAHSQKNAGPHM